MGQLTCSTLLHNSLYICAVRRCASTRTNKPSLRAQKEILRGACGAQFSRPIMWVLRVKLRTSEWWHVPLLLTEPSCWIRVRV